MDVTERLRQLLGTPAAPRALGGFFDGLLQTFENCRAGLSDAQAGAGGADVERYFAQLYEKEKPRLEDAVALHAPHLTADGRAQLLAALDERARGVVVPAYARLAAPLTVRERNDFYVTASSLHALERLGLAAAGMLLGAFIVWAPFIPIWSKELVLVTGVGGLLFPEVRRLLALRRYQGELNRLVTRTDADVARLEMALLTGDVVLRGGHRADEDALAEADEPEAAASTEETAKRRNVLRQGGL
jgi:hypothetical protein